MKKLLLMLLLFAFVAVFLGASGQKPDDDGEGAQKTSASGETPISWLEDRTASQMGITSFGEAPELKAMVDSGDLEPVKNRLPDDPKVIEPLGEVGTYGGTIRTSIHDPLLWSDLGHVRLNFLFTTDESCSAVIPDIAEGYDLSADGKEVTVYMRKGMKWSDGELFTANDYEFYYDDIMTNSDFEATDIGWVHWMWRMGGDLAVVEKVDDLTFKIKMAVPYRPVLSMLNHWYMLPAFFVYPKHYAEQFHLKYNPKAQELAEELGYANWQIALTKELNIYPNTDVVKKVPNTGPWVLESEAQLKRTYARNPYYHVVDIEGNQLPYINRIEVNIASNIEVSILDALQGKSDVAGMYLKQSEMQLYKEYEERGNYRLLNWERIYGAYPAVVFNQNHHEPAKREVFQNLKFRQAMSLAINREEINELAFLGLGVPQQATVHYGASFYDPEWAESYAEYDPEKAGELLDEIGMKKGSDGFRTFPDGSDFQLFMNTIEEYIEQSELIKDYWDAIGVRTDLKQVSGQLLTERNLVGDFDLKVQEVDRMLELRAYVPYETLFDPGWGQWGLEWHEWHQWNEAGREGPAPEGEEPPAHVKQYYSDYVNWLQAGSDEEQAEYGYKVFDFHAENLYVIGTVAWPVAPIIISNRIQNVPEKSILSDDLMWFKVAQPAQWYLTD